MIARSSSTDNSIFHIRLLGSAVPRAFYHVIKPLALVDGAVREAVLTPPPPVIVPEVAFEPAAVLVLRQSEPVAGQPVHWVP